MKNATMLYKAPGPHELHGGRFDYVIVGEDDVPGALLDGWFSTTPEAQAAYEESLKPKQIPAAEILPADDAPATREELEAKAKELEIKFDGRTSDKKLGDLIAAALVA